MSKIPIAVLAERYDRLYSNLSIMGHSISIHPLSQSDVITTMNPDILILDCGQNPLKGLNLLKEIKTKRPDIPIIFVTDESSEDIVIKAFKAGAREFFKKPLDINEFTIRLKDLLLLKRQSKRNGYSASRKDIIKIVESIGNEVPPNILKVIYFMNDHLGDRLSLVDMAKEAGLSRFHFCRHFKKFTGMTPIKFLCKLRLERAKILLSNPEKKISEIATEVGFDDLSNFIRHFKKYTGFTPGSYRKEFYKIDSIE